jgi:hypothetical protein
MNDTPETDDQPIIYALNELEYQVLCVDLEFARKLERERDEARNGREAYKQLAIKHAQERDEAREAFVIATDQMVIAQGKVREANKERDEARAAIPVGEWVEYADYKRVHDAASRLLVAINKQLPIGIFSLIETEYRSLKDAIYGRERAK